MIVYRLESESGYGVFSTVARALLDDGTAMYSVHSCTLRSQGLVPNNRKYRFACESIDKLVEYWGSDFANLLAQGYKVAVYKVRKNYVLLSHIPGLECAFVAEKAIYLCD